MFRIEAETLTTGWRPATSQPIAFNTRVSNSTADSADPILRQMEGYSMLRRSLRLLAAFLMMQASRLTPARYSLDEFMTTGSTIQIGLRKLPMTSSRALLAIILLATAARSLCAEAERRSPQGGFYEITVRLELPHLERWGVDKTTIICLSRSRNGDEIPIPVLSANNPFAKCTSANLGADGPRLEYDIVCPGRGAAKGHAAYTFSAETFSGRVAMVMGAKNMTMTEMQHARRIGPCSPAMEESAVRF